MDTYLIVAQSITQAQQMHRTLYQAGIPSQIVRGHRAVTPYGCGYTLQISKRDLNASVKSLQRAGFAPFRVYCFSRGTYQEVLI